MPSHTPSPHSQPDGETISKTIVNRCRHLQPIAASPVFNLDKHPLALPPAPVDEDDEVAAQQASTIEWHIPRPPIAFLRHASSERSSSNSEHQSNSSFQSSTPPLSIRQCQAWANHLPITSREAKHRFMRRSSCLSKEPRLHS